MNVIIITIELETCVGIFIGDGTLVEIGQMVVRGSGFVRVREWISEGVDKWGEMWGSE